MGNWNEVARAVPQLADKVQQRFEAHGLSLMATLRRDGSPRISGVEILFGEGEVWLGMMPGSVKAADLQRDPRVALHSATADKEVGQGDAKIGGLAVEVQDEETFERYRAVQGKGAPAFGSFNLFLVDVREMSFLIPAGDHLDIEWWTERNGYQSVDRY